MSTDVIAVDVNTDQEEVADLVEKYDFMAIPVVDGDGRLLGAVTVDDVIDVIAACLLLGPGYNDFGIEQIEVDLQAGEHLKPLAPGAPGHRCVPASPGCVGGGHHGE